ncbi:ATP-binding cassette domain-containing protein [Streptomyces sp. NPDC005921]
MPLLDVSGVTVSFGGNRALDGVAMSADRGRITGLIGPNGAGKSTLFDVVSGLRRPSAGRVALDGRDVTRLGPARRCRHGLARTFQRLELFGRLSVRDNLLVAAELGPGRRRAAALADELLDRLGLTGIADTRADNLPPASPAWSRSAAPWPYGPRCSSSTSPPPGRTARRPNGSRPCCARSPPTAPPSSWSNTTWGWSWASATRCTYSTSARSSP